MSTKYQRLDDIQFLILIKICYIGILYIIYNLYNRIIKKTITIICNIDIIFYNRKVQLFPLDQVYKVYFPKGTQ